MPTRQRPVDLGADDARHLARVLGQELRDSRLALGLSQRFVAAAAGMSPSVLGRMERAEVRELPLAHVARAARVLGLRLSSRLYPAGSPARDAGQLRLLARYEGLLGSPLRLRREVPIPNDADLRAWDGVVVGPAALAFTDAETRLLDLQAVARRIALKRRDDPRATVVILLIARSAHNLRVLREHRETLRADFPLDGPAIRRALREGRVPGASGLLVL